MRRLLLLLFLSPFLLHAQRLAPVGTYFRDAFFVRLADSSEANKHIIEVNGDVKPPASKIASTPPFFPENADALYRFLKDTSKRYSDFGHYLYHRELIELKDGNAKLWITPLFDVSYLRESADTSGKKYQNTRGARAEGVFGDKVFFSTSFYENQAILMSYADAYVRQRGEQYPRLDSTYLTQNAVIPGSARTKPFKVNGFDYAYATGMVHVNATKKLEITLGNQPFFFGSGYRSLLWSDNSLPFMHLDLQYRFSKCWNAQIIRGRGLNLMRRSYTSSAEALYEPKLLSLAMLSFYPNLGKSATRTLTISLFEGGTWYRGDSLSQAKIPALYYVPLPGVASAQQLSDDHSALAIAGLDLKLRLGRQWIYGQFAATQGQKKGLVYQLGTRIFPSKNPFFHFLLEYNHADDAAYMSVNARNNYSNGNLPIAHPAANGFDELLLRGNWEKKHWFVGVQANYYPKQQTNLTLLMPVDKGGAMGTQTVINTLVEAGYRFNRSYCLEAFASFRYRHAEGLADYEKSWVTVGVRTNINNHYFDF